MALKPYKSRNSKGKTTLPNVVLHGNVFFSIQNVSYSLYHARVYTKETALYIHNISPL